MDYNNRWLEYMRGKGMFINEAEALSKKISPLFYPAPEDTDIAHSIYQKGSNRISNVVNMTPDDYLKQSYNTYHYNRPTSSIYVGYDNWLSNLQRETETGELLNKIARGQKLDMPELRYDEFGGGLAQEGNHRAMAAKLVGEKNIPVAITTYPGKKGVGDAVKKNISKALRFGGKVLMGIDNPLLIFDMLKLQGRYPYSEKELQEFRNRVY